MEKMITSAKAKERFKRTVVVASILICIGPLAAAQVRTDKENDDLKGPVKTLIESAADLINEGGNWIEKASSASTIISYDKKGNKTNEVHYQQDGTIYFEEVFFYTYLKRGRAVATKLHEIKFPKTGEHQSWKSVYAYNGEVKPIELRIYDRDGELVARSVYSYDSAGRQARELWYNQSGDVTAEIISQYDKNGNRTVKGRPEPHGLTNSVFVYDVRGRDIESRTYSWEGALLDKSVFVYDLRGRLVEDTKQSGDGSTLSKTAYSYKFDRVGNWVELTTWQWVTRESQAYFEPTSKQRRLISYYH